VILFVQCGVLSGSVVCICRVGQSHIYIRCMYGFYLGRDSTSYTVIHTWGICTVMANSRHSPAQVYTHGDACK